MHDPSRVVLGLEDLATFDPDHHKEGDIQRSCCPVCGGGKSVNALHRCFRYSAAQGFYHCHRCGIKGYLKDFWKKSDGSMGSSASSSWTPRLVYTGPKEPDTAWKSKMSKTRAIGGTPSQTYLESRGIDLVTASLSGVRHSDEFLRPSDKYPGHHDRPAVVFPVKDKDWKIVACQGRYLRVRGENDPSGLPAQIKARTLGDKSLGVFSDPGDWLGPRIFITEAPIDKLSLNVCGFAAVSTQGTKGIAEWLKLEISRKGLIPVMAFDADDEGELRSKIYGAQLKEACGICFRARPVKELNDWNKMLTEAGVALIQECCNNAEGYK